MQNSIPVSAPGASPGFVASTGFASDANVPLGRAQPPAGNVSSTPQKTGRKVHHGNRPLRFSGRFFELSVVRAPGARSDSSGAQQDTQPTVQVSVAKRLVRSAVRRNTVKRIVREAWRQFLVQAASGAESLAQTAQGEKGMQVAQVGGHGWRVRLKAHPWGTHAAKSQFARAALRRQALKSGKSPVGVLPGFGETKRQLRADIDSLLNDAESRLKKVQADKPRPRALGKPAGHGGDSR
ncbi:MAG: ribonuclease P protein component [Lautropia sp.]|nr:ribonuclease P protein component [Lautropia sp.]